MVVTYVPPSCASWRGAWRARGRSRRRRRAGVRPTWPRRSLKQPQQRAIGQHKRNGQKWWWLLELLAETSNVNLTGEVALLGRSLDVGGGLDHGDVELLAVAAGAPVHLGEPHGGGVLDGAARLAPALVHRSRAHRHRRPRRRLDARLALSSKSSRGRGLRVARFSF